MLILPLQTQRLSHGDDLASALREAIQKSPAQELHPGDILAVSSKALAACEGATIDLNALKPGPEATTLAEASGRSPLFCQAVLEECERLHGTVRGTCPGALITELMPEGMEGSLLVPNAGLDESNTPQGTAIGWPRDPVASVRRMQQDIKICDKGEACPALTSNHQATIALLLTDSCLVPRRWGVTAFALVAAGIDPLRSEQGNRDLYGKPIRITTEAIGDQLATAANAVMGNVAQSCPAALIRDHGLAYSDFSGWVPGITPQEDLFHGLI